MDQRQKYAYVMVITKHTQVASPRMTEMKLRKVIRVITVH
jgi:hypothetical protein